MRGLCACFVFLRVRLLPGGAAPVGTLLLWPWAASHIHPTARWCLYRVGLSVVSVSPSHTHRHTHWLSTDLLAEMNVDAQQGSSFLLSAEAPPHAASSFTSNAKNPVAMATMPTASSTLSFPQAGHPMGSLWLHCRPFEVFLWVCVFSDFFFFLFSHGASERVFVLSSQCCVCWRPPRQSVWQRGIW